MWARLKVALFVAQISIWSLEFVSGELTSGSESDYGNGNIIVNTKSHTTHFNKGIFFYFVH